MSNNSEIIPLALICIKGQWWSRAVLYQIDRMNLNKDSEEYLNQVQRMADDHFLKVSLYKLFQWLKELDK